MIPKNIEYTETAIFCHECCGASLSWRNKFQLEHPNVEIIEKNYFNTYHEGLHTKYGFDINDLKKGSFIIYQNKLIREIDANNAKV